MNSHVRHIRQYHSRLTRVTDYIRNNLADELPLATLCELANFSSFHFHRQFRYAAGVPLNRFIRLLRIKHACYQLAYDDQLSVARISETCNFDNSESFSRAFKKILGQSPTDFRQSPDWETANKIFAEINFTFSTQEKDKMDVRIVTHDNINVAVLEHHGSPARLHHSVAQFIAWRKESGQSPVKSSMTIGVPWCDPDTVTPEEFRFDICGSLNEGEEIDTNDFDVVRKQIPGGRFAVYRHTGSTDLIDGPCRALYSDWLPQSGEKLREFPCFFHYIQRMPAVEEHKQITDIYLPLI